jgi:biotin carboxyl carrier protein
MLEIEAGGRKWVVEVDGASRVRLNGEEQPCSCVRLPDGRYSLIIAGRVFDLSVVPDRELWTVTGREGSQSLRVVDPRVSFSDSARGPGPSGPQRLCAEMPGKVVRVLVQPGDKVSVDDALLVLEAMKMQNEIRAPKAGLIREVAVEPGQTVATGEFLISLE